MPRKEYYCEQNNSFNEFDHGRKCCCPPCCPPCPPPKPPYPPKQLLISAQATYIDDQEVDEWDPFKFDGFDGISNTDASAPLYWDGTGIIFKRAGRFIITFGTVVCLKDTHPGQSGNDVKIALKLGGEIVPASIARARNTDSHDWTHITISKTVLVNVAAGQKLQLYCLENDYEECNDFKYTALVIDEKES